jgi:hypothetical protein
VSRCLADEIAGYHPRLGHGLDPSIPARVNVFETPGSIIY